jgi:SHS2 domain-containing protein
MKFDYPDITKSDVCVRAWGKDLEEAFVNMALGSFNVVTPIEKIRPVKEERVDISSEDIKSLLYDWIEHLIVKFDGEMTVFSKFSIGISKSRGKYHLKGKMFGDKIRKTHEIHTHLKAVTYHLMKIEKTKKGYELQLILDI